MTDWNTRLDIVVKIVGLIGTVVSIVLWLQKRWAKQTEIANQHVLQARMESLRSHLKGVATNIQLLIRRADDENVAHTELQSMARMARTDVVACLKSLGNTEQALKEWHFGELLRSVDPDSEDSQTTAEPDAEPKRAS